jgi:hypothetical protein
MFLPNKYTEWYQKLITKRQSLEVNGYGELHHIIPKSLGGSNAKSNLVRLTAREHFVAHRLLVRMTSGNAKRKMCFALMRTTSSKTHIPNSRTLELVRELYANQLRGVPRSEETKRKISEKLKGIPLSEEVKAKISLGCKGLSKTESFKEKARERMTDPIRDAGRREKIRASLRGRKLSDETKQKISETRRKGL